MADSVPPDADDPFSPENAPMLNFIMQARLYDVLMGVLSCTDKALANEILKAHATGTLVGPSPAFTGHFIFDELNTDTTD